jgi:hypothetical protein
LCHFIRRLLHRFKSRIVFFTDASTVSQFGLQLLLHFTLNNEDKKEEKKKEEEDEAEKKIKIFLKIMPAEGILKTIMEDNFMDKTEVL